MGIDVNYNLSQDFSFNAVANNPPVFSTSGITSVVEGGAYSYTPTATDADSDPVTITAQTLPIWMTFVGGVLSGDSTGVVPGSYLVELIASDGTDSVTQNFTVVVSARPIIRPTEPSVNSIPLVLVTGDDFDQLVTLEYGKPKASYDFSYATNVTVTVVADKNSERFSDAVQQVDLENDASWADGVLALYLPSNFTKKLDVDGHAPGDSKARFQIRVQMPGRLYSWFANVTLINGH